MPNPNENRVVMRFDTENVDGALQDLDRVIAARDRLLGGSPGGAPAGPASPTLAAQTYAPTAPAGYYNASPNEGFGPEATAGALDRRIHELQQQTQAAIAQNPGNIYASGGYNGPHTGDALGGGGELSLRFSEGTQRILQAAQLLEQALRPLAGGAGGLAPSAGLPVSAPGSEFGGAEYDMHDLSRLMGGAPGQSASQASVRHTQAQVQWLNQHMDQAASANPVQAVAPSAEPQIASAPGAPAFTAPRTIQEAQRLGVERAVSDNARASALVPFAGSPFGMMTEMDDGRGNNITIQPNGSVPEEEGASGGKFGRMFQRWSAWNNIGAGINTAISFGSIYAQERAMIERGQYVTPEMIESNRLGYWAAGAGVVGGLVGGTIGNTLAPGGFGLAMGMGIGSGVGSSAANMLIGPRRAELEREQEQRVLGTMLWYLEGNRYSPSVTDSMAQSMSATGTMGSVPLARGWERFANVLGHDGGNYRSFLASLFNQSPTAPGVYEQRTEFLTGQLADPWNAALRRYARSGAAVGSSAFAELSESNAYLAAGNADFGAVTQWGQFYREPAGNFSAQAMAERSSSYLRQAGLAAAQASLMQSQASMISATGGSPFAAGQALEAGVPSAMSAAYYATEGKIQAAQLALAHAADPAQREKALYALRSAQAERQAGYAQAAQQQQSAEQAQVAGLMLGPQQTLALAGINMEVGQFFGTGTRGAYSALEAGQQQMFAATATALTYHNLPYEQRLQLQRQLAQTTASQAMLPMQEALSAYQIAGRGVAAQEGLAGAQMQLAQVMGAWGSGLSAPLEAQATAARSGEEAAAAYAAEVRSLYAQGRASAVQVTEAQQALTASHVRSVEAQANAAIVPYQSAMTVYGTLGGAIGAQAGALGTMGLGTAATLPLVQQQYGALQQQQAMAMGVYQQSLAMFGPDSERTINAQAQLAGFEQQFAQARLGMAQFDPGSRFRMREAATGFALQAATRTFSGYGEVRGLVREQMGLAQERIAGIGALRSRLAAQGMLDPSGEEALQRQEIEARGQYLQGLETLEHGWQERIVSQVMGMPGSFSAVAREFDPIRGVMDFGTSNRFYGASGSDVQGYRLRAALYSNTVAGNPAHPMSASANALLGNPAGRGWSLAEAALRGGGDIGDIHSAGSVNLSSRQLDTASRSLNEAASSLAESAKALAATLSGAKVGPGSDGLKWEQTTGYNAALGRTATGTVRGF